MQKFSIRTVCLAASLICAMPVVGSLSGCNGSNNNGNVTVPNPFAGNYTGTYVLLSGETAPFALSLDASGKVQASLTSPTVGKVGLSGTASQNGQLSASGSIMVQGQTVSFQVTGNFRNQSGVNIVSGTLTVQNGNNGTFSGRQTS